MLHLITNPDNKVDSEFSAALHTKRGHGNICYIGNQRQIF